MPAPSNQALQKLSKDQMATAMQKMRNRADRYRKNAEAMSEKLLNASAGAATAGVLGHIMGSAEAEYRKIRSNLMATEGLSLEDAEKKIAETGDPRKLFGMDKDVVISGGLFVLGITGVLGKRVSPVMEAAGAGGLAGVAHAFGFDMAMEAAEKEAEAAA